jgi:hypothetical protein
MKWEKGDIAICIKVGDINSLPGPNPPLRLNGEYIVQNVNDCVCGSIKLDVGISTGDVNCSQCGCGRVTLNEPIWWCSSTRFTKKDIRTDEEKLEEALKIEDYETAAKLKANEKSH